MSDSAEDQDGTAQEVTEQPLSAWTEPADTPAWSQIADQAQPGTGSAESEQAPQAGADAQPEAAGARSRRPSSLRAPDAVASGVPRRRLAPPAFPGSPASSDPPVQPPVSETAAPGKSGQVSNPGSSLIEKLPIAQIKTLVRERPEVGLGLCFAGGLLIATMLKRLGH